MPRKSMFSIVIAAVTLLIAGGCGGSGGGSSHHNNDLTGNYTGTVPVQTGYTGALTFSVIPGGTAEGTLVVSADAMAPRVAPDGIPAGTYQMNGSLDQNNHLILTSLDGEEALSIGCIIAGDGTGSNAFSMTYGSFTWQGTLTKGEDPGDGDVAADMTFSAASGTNADTTHFPHGAVTATANADETEVSLFVRDADNRLVSVTVPNSLAVGDTYTFDSLHRFATYAQDGSDFLQDTWAAESGTMTLVSRNGDHVSVTFTDVHFTAVTNFGDGTGSFTLNGSMHN